MNDKYGHNPEQRRQRRIERIGLGLCPVHADYRVVPGRTKCEKCLLTTRISSLRTKGLPDDELERARQAVSEFNGCCDICGSRESRNDSRGFVLDHDDEFKVFRGILCHGCNLAIGHAGEEIARLQAMIQYLTERTGPFIVFGRRIKSELTALPGCGSLEPL